MMKKIPETRTEFVVRNLTAMSPRWKNWERLAKEINIPFSTVRKVAYRETKDPRASTLDALFDYFNNK